MNLSRKVLIAVVMLAVLTVSRASTIRPVAASDDDGRVNLIPWVNSWGAIALYCVDKFDHPGAAFTGGGIKILTPSGQKIYFAPEKTITAAQIKADKIGGPVLILTQGVYSLYALPDGYFKLLSAPDSEGKTFIAQWYGCRQVGPGPSQTTNTCTPAVQPTECKDFEGLDACLAANNGDSNCNGNLNDDENYCFSNLEECQAS